MSITTKRNTQVYNMRHQTYNYSLTLHIRNLFLWRHFHLLRRHLGSDLAILIHQENQWLSGWFRWL